MPDEPKEPEHNAPPPAEAPASPPRRSLRILLVAGLLLGVFVVALCGSWRLRKGSIDSVDSANPPHSQPKVVPRELLKPASPVEILARGDSALRQLRYAEALSHYKEFLGTGVARTAEIHFRLGLCNEAAGKLDDAIASYRSAISASPSPSLTVACHLGMARCLLCQGSPIEARRVLYPFLLDERRHQNLPEAFVNDACYLAALSLAHERVDFASKQLAQDSPISFASVPLQTRSYLDEIALEVPARVESSGVTIPVPLAVRKRSNNEPAIVLCVEQTEQLAWDLLTQLAVEGGMKVEWTAEAKRSLTDRSLPMHLHNWELRDVLEAASDHLDLTCQIEGDLVRFSTKTETERKLQHSLRHDMAHRFLLAALRADSVNPYAAAALLELGNNEATQNRWNEAAVWYGRLIREVTFSPYVAASYYNLARAHLRNNDASQARKNFFRVMDQSPGHELALRACLQIGQLYLYEDDVRQAIVHLRRAQSVAERSPYHPIATLALTAAYLQDGDLEAAHRTLAQNGAVLQLEPYRPTAAFLERYVQYRLAKAKSGASQRDVGDLVGTLWRDKGDTVLGAYGQWLIARAYRDLGFWDQAEQVLRRSLVDAQGPFKTCVEFTLADTLVKRDQRAEAAQIFSRCAEAETPYRARARFELARIDLQEKRFRECEEMCRKLWNERSLSDPSALLNVWGAALEGKGDLAKAAQCYAGKAPE